MLKQFLFLFEQGGFDENISSEQGIHFKRKELSLSEMAKHVLCLTQSSSMGISMSSDAFLSNIVCDRVSYSFGKVALLPLTINFNLFFYF